MKRQQLPRRMRMVVTLAIDAWRVLREVVRQPRLSWRIFKRLPESLRGFRYGETYREVAIQSSRPAAPQIVRSNPLQEYFDAHEDGRGIWKWEHYFDVYHRHFAKFVGSAVTVVEVAIYSGGSLLVWQHYLGENCHVYGIDIEEACAEYESDTVSVFIGDQGDPDFWRRFRKAVPDVDILIDDGGHLPEQQMVTLQEMLPHIRPGGVYLCEDVHRHHNGFDAFVHGLANQFNALTVEEHVELTSIPTESQRRIHSIHKYPFVTVIEKADRQLDHMICRRRGTLWQPSGFTFGAPD